MENLSALKISLLNYVKKKDTISEVPVYLIEWESARPQNS